MELIHGVLNIAVAQGEDMAYMGSALINIQGIAHGLPVRTKDTYPLCGFIKHAYFLFTDKTPVVISIRFRGTMFADPRTFSYLATV